MTAPRRLTNAGRLVVAGIIIGLSAVAACSLIMVPSRFGFG